jgi:hypothetical protein
MARHSGCATSDKRAGIGLWLQPALGRACPRRLDEMTSLSSDDSPPMNGGIACAVCAGCVCDVCVMCV